MASSELRPARSRTDPSSANQTKSERPHLSRRLHANSLRNQLYGSSSHAHHRHRAKDTVQSAIDLKPPITFEHLLRRDKKSPDSSRRTSAIPPSQPDASNSVQQNERPAKIVRPADVAQAKKDNALREEELRRSLKSVEEVGMSSTRQLDDTYYAILEKASILQSTVASLQQLADESRRMHEGFDEDTRKLEQETTQNLDGFGDFQQQDKTINELVTRLQNSRGRTDKLNDRLESARLRVETYEQRENDKQATRRKRFHITWALMLALIMLVIAVVLAKNRRRVGHQLDTVGKQLVKLGDLAEDVASPLAIRLRPSPSEDPYLQKLFDEL